MNPEENRAGAVRAAEVSETDAQIIADKLWLSVSIVRAVLKELAKVLAAAIPPSDEPRIAGDGGTTELAKRLQAFRNAHWTHWTADENQLVVDCFHALRVTAGDAEKRREQALRLAGAAGPKCERCKDSGWHYSDPMDPTSLEPCCETVGAKGTAE